jgi:type I restriction enzyme S subunit
MKNGWQTKTLGDTCVMYQPKTISGKDMVADGAYPVFGANGVIGRYNQFNHEDPQLLVTCRGATCGSVNVSAPRSWITGNAMVVRPKNESLEMRYLEYLFRGGIDISKAITGAAQPQITRTNLEPLEISYPASLAEQQRIVGLLDEAFEGLATAKANAEKNLQNARALFESHLQSIFSQGGVWCVEKKLEDIADSDCSLSYGIVQPGEEFDEGMPIVRPTDLTTKVIRLGGLKRIDPKLAGGYKRTALQGGELLLCVRGSTGVVSIASPELVGANVTRGIVPIRFNRSLLLPEFGFYLISGGPVQSQIREKTYGTALMQINIRDLRLISLAIPPLKEQKTIAANLDSLHEETQRLARLYERKLVALEALKKSLLHQAFSGKL